MASSRVRVAVVFGGRSVEHEVSVRSARSVADGLTRAGHDVLPVGIAPDGGVVEPLIAARVLAGLAARLPAAEVPPAATFRRFFEGSPDVVFPLVHGTYGEDGSLQGLCEMLDLPYVGAGVTASALAMDKRLAKRALAATGVPVVPGLEVSRAAFVRNPRSTLAGAAVLRPPLFVKPSVGGSSVGVTRVDDLGELAAAVESGLCFDEWVLVEQGVIGRELECAVLGDEPLEAAEAIGEIVPGRKFYDYVDKYLDDGAELTAPAALPPQVGDRIRDLAVRAFEAVGGHGMCRVDFLLGGADELYVNELNTLPGFTTISMYPRLWELSGVPIVELCDRLVAIALRRHAARRRLDAGIQAWLGGLSADT